jgi:DNA-directed RNA polymerase specialized sigma24 family protein
MGILLILVGTFSGVLAAMPKSGEWMVKIKKIIGFFLIGLGEYFLLFSKGKNNRRFFRKLAYPHIRFLYNMALRYAGNTYDAEDMVQETLYIALKRISQLRDETKCKSWLFSILRHIHIKEIRANFRKQIFEYDESLDYISFLEAMADRFDTEKALE